MTKEELQGIFSDALAPVLQRIDAIEAKQNETPATDEPVEREAGDEIAGLTEAVRLLTDKVDELTNEDTGSVHQLAEVAEKVLDRVEALEKRATGRTSIDGQDGDEAPTGSDAKPTLKDAISKALKNPGETVTIGG